MQTHKLSIFNPKKSKFSLDDDQSPHSVRSTKKTDFQTDDSDSGTPGIQNIKYKVSKYKPEQRILQAGRSVIQLHNVKQIQKVQSDVDQKTERIKNIPYRHLVFQEHISEEALKRHLQVTQKGLTYAIKCLRGPSDSFIKHKSIEVPLAEHKSKILVLDLDETLVHSCSAKDHPEQFVIAEDGTSIGINIRPFLKEFLDTMSKVYSIYVFTASSSAYANAIIDHIDPQQERILGILTRNHCMETKNGFFIKDLRILRGVPMKDIIIVDNLSHSFGLQIENGIPILEWTNDRKDQELKYLSDYLIEAAQYHDVREFNAKRLQLRQLIDLDI